MENISLFGYSFYKIILYFTLYSFIGWCMEVAYTFYTHHRFVNRGFLYGPFCPMYGFGTTLVIVFSRPCNTGIIKLFFICATAASLLEYVTSYVLEKVFHSRWWDYSDNFLNINGRICISYSILWGILGVVVIKFLHPSGVGWLTELIPGSIRIKLMYAIIIYFIMDFTFTIISLVRLRKLFMQLENIRDEVKKLFENLKASASEGKLAFEKIPEEFKGKKIDVQNFLKEKMISAELLRYIPEDIRNRYEHIINNISERYERLFMAFPEFKKNVVEKFITKFKNKINENKEDKF